MRLIFAPLCLMLAGCLSAPAPEVARQFDTGVLTETAPGICRAEEETPAIVDTLTELVLMEPPGLAPDGTLRTEPIYREEVRETVLAEGARLSFETPCPDALTPAFVATLQRALAARGLYSGAITGEIDVKTRAAIRAYQAPRGLDTGTLSIQAARSLGLVPIARDAG